MCQLEMQPKQHSGKVNGLKNSFKGLLRSFGVLGVGLFWESSQGTALWCGSSICALLIVVLTLPMLYVITLIDGEAAEQMADTFAGKDSGEKPVV